MRATVMLLSILIAAGCGGTGEPSAIERVGRDSPRYQSYWNEALALRQRGDAGGALSKAARALVAAPDAREPYELMSGIYMELGEDGDAVAFFEKAAVRFPDRPEPRLFQGFHEFRRGSWDSALQAYEAALALDPSDPEPHFRKGLILQAKGSFDLALDSLRHAHELEPDNATTAARLARLLRISGNYTEAMRTVDDALVASPDAADLHYAKGQLLLHQGNLEEAERSFRRALELNSRHREAHYDLGRLLRRTGRQTQGLWEEALARRLTQFVETREILSGQLRLRPSDPAPALALAELELTEDNYVEALGLFQRAEKNGAPPQRIAAGMAEALFGMGDLERGERAMQLLAGAADGRSELARATRLVALARPAQAVAFIARAVEVGPAEREFLRRAADLYAAAGRPAQARDLLERAASSPAVGPG